MFDLNKSITNWQRHLSDDGSMSAAEIDELTTHLLDQCESLLDAGLNEEEAFIIAAKRVGHPSELSQEFTKLNPLARWRTRLFWMVGGYLGCVLIGTLVLKPASVLLNGYLYEQGYSYGAMMAISCLAASAFIALVLAVAIPLTRSMGQRDRQARKPLRLRAGWVFVGFILCINLIPILNEIVAVSLLNAVDIQHYGYGSAVAEFLAPLITPLMLLILAMAAAHKPVQQREIES